MAPAPRFLLSPPTLLLLLLLLSLALLGARAESAAGSAVPAQSRPCVDCHAFEFMQRALQDLRKTAYSLDARLARTSSQAGTVPAHHSAKLRTQKRPVLLVRGLSLFRLAGHRPGEHDAPPEDFGRALRSDKGVGDGDTSVTAASGRGGGGRAAVGTEARPQRQLCGCSGAGWEASITRCPPGEPQAPHTAPLRAPCPRCRSPARSLRTTGLADFSHSRRPAPPCSRGPPAAQPKSLCFAVTRSLLLTCLVPAGLLALRYYYSRKVILAYLECALHTDMADIEQYYMKPPGSCFWVAVLDGNVVGIVAARAHQEDNTVELLRMSVDSRFRGKGIAKALGRRVLEFAMLHNYSAVVLGTTAVKVAAHKLYESLGFRHMGATDHYVLPGMTLSLAERLFFQVRYHRYRLQLREE
ncbi:N-acetylaspartate synthetase [Microtus ochrogaster]|uniref:N-acetylaspartate synthetase n=1 Tax=Microtus ochrogaster TaxID=79684 RepID=A0A8J6L0W9_MICOH|nr:N-acetylaspartate synthetase [Microtus ochrogaster]